MYATYVWFNQHDAQSPRLSPRVLLTQVQPQGPACRAEPADKGAPDGDQGGQTDSALQGAEHRPTGADETTPASAVVIANVQANIAAAAAAAAGAGEEKCTADRKRVLVPPDSARDWLSLSQLLFAPETTCQGITCLMVWVLLLAACGVAIWLLLPLTVDHIINPALHWVQVSEGIGRQSALGKS